MPSKNRLKVYIENGFYHIYNRGVAKQNIFEDENDYTAFLHLLKYYLSPPNEILVHPLWESGLFKPVRMRALANLHKEIELLCYCLMPNHFHLVVKQITRNGMTNLMRAISTCYAMNFNKKYDRVGYLFQGRYKAALIDNENYLLHLSRYIHQNPSELTGTDPVNWPYSSYQYFLGKKNAIWIKPELILSYFNRNPENSLSYKSFVEEYTNQSDEIIFDYLLETD